MKNSVKILALGIVIAITAFIIFKSYYNAPVIYSFSYLSGAANFKTLFDWCISPDEYNKIAHMSIVDHLKYRYVATKVTIPCTINNYGYVLVVLAARNLFPWLGDIQAVLLLHILLHIVISLFVIEFLLKTRFQRWLFFFLYAVNPVILYVVMLPLYYFWTVLPSVALAIVWLKPDKIRRWLPFITIVMLFSVFIRPATLFVVLVVFAVAFFKNRLKNSQRMVVMSGIIFISSIFWLLQQGVWYSSPFHTAYIGIGAYHNHYGIHGEDSDGFAYYRKNTGNTVSYNLIADNDLNNPKVLANYQSLMKKRYFEIIKESPWLLARNAVLNTIQAFGVGYDNHLVWTRPLTVGIGLLVIALFLFTKEWVWGIGVLAYASAFTFYYPPIVTYLFGAYILTVLGFCFALEKLLFRFLPEHGFFKLLLKH